jgi:hypothetical protein
VGVRPLSVREGGLELLASATTSASASASATRAAADTAAATTAAAAAATDTAAATTTTSTTATTAATTLPQEPGLPRAQEVSSGRVLVELLPRPRLALAKEPVVEVDEEDLVPAHRRFHALPPELEPPAPPRFPLAVHLDAVAPMRCVYTHILIACTMSI